jgi:hypothetical protein
MQSDQVKKIEELTKEMGKLVTEIEPRKPAEWDAMEKLTAAHKQLRSIEIADLLDNTKQYE